MGAFVSAGAWPETLVRRAEIVRAMRAFFDARGFTEVETAVRIAAPAPEPHIDCPPVATGAFLRASPELQMKKLLAAGMERIYQIGPCFRDGERGTRHNPEFTMIEWYRRGATYRDIKADLVALLGELMSVMGIGSDPMPITSAVTGIGSDPIPITRTVGVREAYREYAGWDPWTDWDADRFDLDMATKIEPALRTMGLVFLTDYPPAAASLAQLSPLPTTDDQLLPTSFYQTTNYQLPTNNFSIAERWEFYWDGLELANCFTELCDEPEQRRRFAAAKAERQALGESDYPLDEAFFAALPAMGPSAGVALGVDRLVMKLLGFNDIASVRAAT